MNVVVDTSVAIKWLNDSNEDYTEQATRIMSDASSGNVTLLAPELLKYEAGNVLRYAEKLTNAEAKIVLATLYSLPIMFVRETQELASRTYEIAALHDITYYDASFVVLAEVYDALLVTDNLKHQGKAKTAQVKALKNY